MSGTKQGRWNRWIVWRWLVPLFGLIIGRFHAPAHKILKCLAGALLLTLLLAAISLAVPPLPGQAQEEDWEISYEEHFEGDEPPEGWKLEGGWGVGDDMLIGEDHGQARYTEGNWGDAQITFRLAHLWDILHANVRVSEDSYYTIDLQRQGPIPVFYIYLRKQTGPTSIELATNVVGVVPSWDPDTRVEIVTIGGDIQVKVNGTVVMEYTDPEPLPPGTIVFETLDGSYVEVDDIIVYGPPEYILTMAVDGNGSTEPEVGNHTFRAGGEAPITARPDDGWEFAGWEGDVADPDNPTTTVIMDSDKKVLAMFSEIPTYILTMAVEGNGLTEPEVGNHTFRAGEEAPITARPDDGWEFAGWVGDVTNPDNPATTLIMDSDKTVTARFSEIPPPPVVTPPSDRNPWPPVIVGIVFILAGTLSTQQVIKSRRHKKWQKEAKEEEPQEPCQPGARCCHKVESECELARCQVKHLTLLAHDTVSGELSQKEQVQGEIVDRLNRVIAASRRGETLENLEEQVTPLARRLLQQITNWLRPEPVPRDVSVIGHLEGCKVTYKFSLKRCQETRTWGEPEEEWKVTIKEERDEPLSVLPGLEPTKIGMPEQLIAELTRQLMKFIEFGR